MANWDSKTYAMQLAPPVAQFRIDLQMICSRIALFARENWAGRLVRGTTRSLFAVWDLLFVFGGHANGAGAAHGLLLPPGDDDRLAGQSDCRAAHAVDDAGCSPGSCGGVCLSLVCKGSGACDIVCAGRHHGDDSRSGRTPPGRPAGRDAIVGDDGARGGLSPSCDLDRAAENRPDERGTGGNPGHLAGFGIRRPASAYAFARNGGHRDRCWRGRFHRGYHSCRENAARGCGRPDRAWRLATGFRRGRSLAVSMDARYHSSGCSRDYARALRSYRRDDCRPEEFSAEEIVGRFAAAE